ITQAQNAAPGIVNRPVADELRRWEEARNLRNLGIANPRPWAPLVRTTGQAAPDPYWGGAPYQIDDPVLAHETANPPFIRRENARP
ncbi:MAG: hypothetical protein LBJ42_00495, partial [Holosporales bacterium]|nr:hypothetical protein [Holosporales bacterium]